MKLRYLSHITFAGMVMLLVTLASMASAQDKAKPAADAADTASYIEIVGGKHDYPAGVKLFGTRLAELYGI